MTKLLYNKHLIEILFSVTTENKILILLMYDIKKTFYHFSNLCILFNSVVINVFILKYYPYSVLFLHLYFFLIKLFWQSTRSYQLSVDYQL